MLIKIFTLAKNVLNAYIAFLIFCFIKKQKKSWLVGGVNGELYTDNSKVFYEYLLDNNKEISLYWIARRNSPAYHKAKGTVIEKGSIKNYLYFFKSEVVIFSDTLNSDIAPVLFMMPLIRRYYKKVFKVRLNHGTISFKKMPVSPHAFIQKIKDKILLSYDMSTASTELEVKVMSTYMRKGTVHLTGSARNDNIKDIPLKENVIFIAPTWRTWLYKEKSIENSEFYKNYSKLLSNKEFLKILREKNIKIDFFLHHFLLKFQSEFARFENDIVRILPFSADLFSRIIGASLMITDYSSICAERYFLQKPVLFFQFDRKRYSTEMESYIDLENDTFGDCSLTVNDTVDKINFYLANKFQMSPSQKEGEKHFVHFRDSNNCNRIFKTIKENSEISI